MTNNNTDSRVRRLIFFHRKKGMSVEDFEYYWEHTHAEVACSIPIFKKNLLSYKQIHVNRNSLQTLRDGGGQVTDYDGIVVLEAESEEKINEIFQDEEYLRRLKPDEEKFSERSSFVLMPARVVTIFDTQS